MKIHRLTGVSTQRDLVSEFRLPKSVSQHQTPSVEVLPSWRKPVLFNDTPIAYRDVVQSRLGSALLLPESSLMQLRTGLPVVQDAVDALLRKTGARAASVVVVPDYDREEALFIGAKPQLHFMAAADHNRNPFDLTASTIAALREEVAKSKSTLRLSGFDIVIPQKLQRTDA